MTHTFNVVYEDAGDGWVYAHVPELPEVHTQSETLDQAREMARDAIALIATGQEGHDVRHHRLPVTVSLAAAWNATHRPSAPSQTNSPSGAARSFMPLRSCHEAGPREREEPDGHRDRGHQHRSGHDLVQHGWSHRGRVT